MTLLFMLAVPEVIFKTRVNDTHVVGGGCAIGGEWKNVSTHDLFANKKIILFALPGAFTPTCSSQQLPGYEKLYNHFKNYIDEVYCLAVNDSFVMNAWFRDQQISLVKPLPDGEGKFTDGMGMLVNKPKQGFGFRSWRYSAYVNNCLIQKMFVEEGWNNFSKDSDPFKISDAETMLNYLQDHQSH